jgi:type IV pilus assembly protein PilY1
VISTSGGASYSSSGTLSSALTLTSVTVPTVGTNQGDLTCNSNCAPTSNQTYGTVSVQGGSTITLNASTYVMDSFKLSGNSTLAIGTSPIIVYIKCSSTTNNALDLSGGTVVNSSQKSTNLVFMLASTCATASISGGANASYAVYAPDTDVTISGGGVLYGAVVAKSVKDTGGSAIYYDKALKNFAGGGFSCTSTEVSRASPVVATISSQTSLVQGTYESPTGLATTLSNSASITSWSFPWIKGHMRARVASTVTSASFSSGTVQFDAATAGNIPTTITSCSAPYTGSCRGIFTNTNSTSASGTTFGSALGVTNLDYNNSATSSSIGAKIVSGLTATDYSNIIKKIQQASLGGVDRSTVAVIQASTFAGSGTRPTVAYFGALDGMLHAVCASTGGATASVSSNACPSLGKELWAFMPRVSLPLLANNVGRIDGSVRVTDVFGDFTSGTGGGTKSWHTILTFQTGFGIGTTPAIYALDITDPNSPSLLWEVTAPGTSPGTVDVGTGLTMTAGPTLINGQTTNLMVAETNNGGSASATTAGIAATAIQAETGNRKWQFTYSYPTPPRGVSADMPMALIGIPGGAVGVDLNGYGYYTDFVMGDLYGNLWLLNASTGVSRHGTSTPLFSFSTNKMPIGAPPAVYSDGTNQYAAFASGGYADPTSTAWTTTGQRIIAVKMQYTTGSLSELSSSSYVPVNQAFSGAAASDKSYAQATIVGTQLYVTSDSSDVNLSTYGTSGTATGHLTTVDLTGAAATTVLTMTPVANGAGSVVNNTGGTQVYGAYQLTSTNGSTGTSVDLTASAKVTRNLWLRTM